MALLITDDIKHEILDRTDLVALVSEVVPLKRVGHRLAGLCPFHTDSKPSFYVNQEQGFYHCFGCNEHGDAISFLQKTQSLGFVEAVVELAKRAGVTIPEKRGPRDRMREGLGELLEAAARYYEGRLRDRDAAGVREILDRRGLDAATIEKFRIGYAPPGWDNLMNHLVREGASWQHLVRAGLASERNEGSGAYDRFRNRIIFPIFSRAGRVIAFGGRIIDPNDEPKYLNSPETEMFRKSDVLYGFNFARETVREKKEVLVVEGYMDLIALHQFGFENAVATLGTALTPGHFRILQPYAERLLLLFDADTAGQRAALRGIDVLFEMDVSPHILQLPAGTDPDSLLREQGSGAMEKVREGAVEAFDFRLKMILGERSRLSVDEKVAVVRELAPILHRVPSAVRRADWIGRLASRLSIGEDVISEEVRRAAGRRRKRSDEEVEETYREKDAVVRAKEGLIALLLAGQDVAGAVRELLEEAPARDAYDDILAGLIEMMGKHESLTRGRLLSRFGEEGVRILEQVRMDDPAPKAVEKALGQYCRIIRHGYILHETGQTAGGKNDTIGSLDELRREEERARRRLLLGLGEGFRLPPHPRSHPPAN